MAVVKMMDVRFYGFEGIYEYEREQGGKLYFDVAIETENDDYIDGDDYENAPNMANIYEVMKSVVEGNRVHLIETLAAKVGDGILAQIKGAKSVTTTVKKPSVPIAGDIGYIEAIVTRTK